MTAVSVERPPAGSRGEGRACVTSGECQNSVRDIEFPPSRVAPLPTAPVQRAASSLGVAGGP
eukprot:2927477-Alexandrium_andersonii.AAC.1